MIKLIEQKPIGISRGMAFVTRVDGCNFEPVERPTYDCARGKQFRELRKSLDLTIMEAARRLDLTPTEISGIEWGRYAPADWEALEARLKENRK